MLISPLAKKLCAELGVDPTCLRGTGPRGRIMAEDVRAGFPPERNDSTLAETESHPTRASKDGYYVYDDTVNMQALAQISLPIAVQCEKLLEERYSLFTYIVRAVVKACLSASEWKVDAVDLLLFERDGARLAAVTDAASKSIYRLSKEIGKSSPPPDFCPAIVICDAHTSRSRVADVLCPGHRPDFALVVRGNSPKDNIRAGGDDLSSYEFSYTFYAAQSAVALPVANRIAAELHALLFDPVRLLLID